VAGRRQAALNEITCQQLDEHYMTARAGWTAQPPQGTHSLMEHEAAGCDSGGAGLCPGDRVRIRRNTRAHTDEQCTCDALAGCCAGRHGHERRRGRRLRPAAPGRRVLAPGSAWPLGGWARSRPARGPRPVRRAVWHARLDARPRRRVVADHRRDHLAPGRQRRPLAGPTWNRTAQSTLEAAQIRLIRIPPRPRSARLPAARTRRYGAHLLGVAVTLRGRSST
jgi:hypothetical protein